MLDTSIAVPTLPTRSADGHKGTFGRVFLVAGSRGMAGAAVLTGTAALRGGAGLVEIAVPAEILGSVSVGNPCYLTRPFDQDLRGRFAAAAIDEIVDHALHADVVAIGPGLGQSESMPELVAAFLERCDKPLVIDADGLNALAKVPAARWDRRLGPVILTPHPGEFARLMGSETAVVQKRRTDWAVEYAAEREVVVVLKGANTLVTDGKRLYRNTTGNPGMATGGTGDVLTGVIAALVGQKLAAFEASVLGTWAHGHAGDLAAERLGQTGLIATDLFAYLPIALRERGG